MTIFAPELDSPVTVLIEDRSDDGGLLLAATDSGLHRIYHDGQHEMVYDWEDGRRFVRVFSLEYLNYKLYHNTEKKTIFVSDLEWLTLTTTVCLSPTLINIASPELTS